MLRFRAHTVFHITMEEHPNLAGPEKAETGIGLTCRFKVKAVDRETGTMTIGITYTRGEMNIKSGGQDIEYDSADVPAEVPPGAHWLAAGVGQTCEADVTELGRVEELRGIDELIEKASKEIEAGPKRDAFVRRLKQQFGSKAATNMIEQLLAVYPKRPVDVGDGWKNKVAVRHTLPMKLDRTFELKERGDGVVRLEMKAEITPNPIPVPMGDDFEIKYKATGKQTGIFELDADTGWVRKVSRETRLSAEITPILPEGAHGNPDMPTLSIKGTETIEPVDD